MLYLISKSIDQATRIDVSNLKDKIEIATQSNFGKNCQRNY